MKYKPKSEFGQIVKDEIPVYVVVQQRSSCNIYDGQIFPKINEAFQNLSISNKFGLISYI